MIDPKPVTLERDGIRLEPLSPEHHDGLVAAASDGELWELWFTSVPEPGAVMTYIRDAVKGQSDGHMLPWAVRDLATNTIVGSTRYHDIVPAIDRVEIGYTWYAAALPAHQRQHDLQAAAARARLRHARLRRRRIAHRQLQLPIAEGDRRHRREEGWSAAPSPGETRWHGSRLGDVFSILKEEWRGCSTPSRSCGLNGVNRRASCNPANPGTDH